MFGFIISMQISQVSKTSFNGIKPAYKIQNGMVHPIEKCASIADIAQVSKKFDDIPVGEGRCGRVFQVGNSIIKFFKKFDDKNKMVEHWQNEVENLDTIWELCKQKNNPKYLHNTQKGFFGINLKDKFYIFSSKVDGNHPSPKYMQFNKENLNALMEIFERLDKGYDDVMLLHPDLRCKNVLITNDDAGLIDFGTLVKLKLPTEKNSVWLKNSENLTGNQKFFYRMFAADTDYGISNVKAFEYDLLAPYLYTADKSEGQRMLELYFPLKSEYYAKRADFFYNKFLNDKSDSMKQIFCEEAMHSELLSKLPIDIKKTEIDKLQLNLFVRELLDIVSNNIPVEVNLPAMSRFIFKVLNDIKAKTQLSFISNDKERFSYYSNSLTHANCCAGYAENIFKKYHDVIWFHNTNKPMKLLQDKLL